MAARCLWAARGRVRPLLAARAASDGRARPLPFSTATQRTAGEDCGSEDPPPTERALKLRAVKLEKEVQDLTEFRASVRTWWRWPTFWRRLQGVLLKRPSLGTRSSFRRSSERCRFW
uniref:GrpE like 2, mitochondrial n=1 Tax=Sus scrofa TaxID=9823 RepID=A0A4X1T6E1_PIG